MKKPINKIGCLLSLAVVLLLVSCAIGYEGDYTFESDVRGVTLESPDVESTQFQRSADGSVVTITWKVVYGAGGYAISFYNINDPDNPVLIGEENEIVEKCTAQRVVEDNTKYVVLIKALGNEKYGNKDALTASKADYSTMIIATVVPTGTDLAQYFIDNPIPDDNTDELAFELEAGGTYTMSSDIYIGLNKVTFRGEYKVNLPNLTVTESSFITDGGGITFKDMEINCTNLIETPLIAFNSDMNPEVVQDEWAPVSLVSLQSCKVISLPSKLIYDNNKKYGLQNLLINDCIIEQDSESDHLIRMQAGFIKDAVFTNNTFYNKKVNNSYFIQCNNMRVTNVPSSWGWSDASLVIRNCTFWQMVKTGQMANYDGFARSGNTITIEKCIFVDSGNKAVMRRFLKDQNLERTINYNSYWYDGEFVSDEISSTNNYSDNSGTHLESDPKLKDPENGDFTVGGAEQIAEGTGDSRWLPGAE